MSEEKTTEQEISSLEKNLRNSVEAYAIAKVSQNELLVNLSLMHFNQLMQNTQLLSVEEYAELTFMSSGGTEVDN